MQTKKRPVRVAWLLQTAALMTTGMGGKVEAQTTQKIVNLRAVPFTQVRIADSFWAPRREANRRVSLPHSLDMLEQAGNIRNLERATKGEHSGYEGPVFMDSDLYKTLEAVSYSLATDPDPALEKRVDGIIAKIAAAQRPDGYLNTWYEVNAPDRRFTNLRDNHELYCAGHLFEAAVAHYQATGKKTLLDVATKFADLLCRTFGDGPGQRMGYGGHPEIELALVKLWRITGEQRYFDLARFFVVNRGRHFFAEEHHTPPAQYDGTYWQDDVPIREHRTIKGHAVRAGYLLSGVVDVASQTRDAGLLKMVDRVWRNTTQKRMYVTGGIGPSASNEGFTTDYDLPNLTAYQETCASVAMAMWNHRLNLLYGDAKYADLVERALYNGILAGVSLDGKRFFYVNPLASMGGHHRSGWFGCACCPPNEARTLAALGSYAYALSDDAIWVNLYIQGGADVTVGGRKARLDVTTDYPWGEDVKIALKVAAPAALTSGTHDLAQIALRLRVPEWCPGAKVRVNGEAVAKPERENGYLVLRRTWRTGDTVDLRLPMPVQRVVANPQVKEDAGRVAVQRGPLVYCMEQCDQKAPVSSISLPASSELKPVRQPDLPNGVLALTGTGVMAPETDWSHALYRPVPQPRRVPVTLIPYYAWDNRAPGAMEVWIPTAPPTPRAGGLETSASVTLSFTSGNCRPQGINDSIEPKSSGEQPAALCHWWPHRGGEEWAQYDWKKPLTISGAKVYWFDDTGRGACRLPSAWQILYRDGGEWKPVQGVSSYPVALDRWCEVSFAPVTTTALRLVVRMQPEWAAGVHEWKIVPQED
jgi:DUF1680 family protein